MTRQERIQYFRTVNLGTMIHNHQSSKQAQSLLARMGFDNISGDLYDLEDFVTLTVERDNILRDTFSNLRGQEKRFFRKPLKILMGRESGEIGQDEGGVTSEFFRQALKAVFQTRQGACVSLSHADPTNQDLGMFVIEESQMPWFQPASRVPDSHFEMLGLLFSLAVYNGVSLPVTFPVVLYHYLRDPCSVHSELSLLKDGWPSQYRSFTDFLHSVADYDNDTEQEYVFQFAVGEERVEVDMQAFRDSLWPADYSGTVKPLKGETGVKWPDSTPRPSLESPAWRRPNSDGEEVPLVTIANRHQFVQDYIYWLVIRSVAPQLEAFRKGFLTCLELKTLQVLTPDLLKLIVEGSGEVDVEELKKIAIYEDYKAGQAYIRDFWRVVQEFDMEDRRKLLAFVTASPRVPASGYNSMQFTIVSDGVHMDRLPSSSTCAGILYLPVYPSREILKEKLLLAIQNCEEFYLA